MLKNSIVPLIQFLLTVDPLYQITFYLPSRRRSQSASSLGSTSPRYLTVAAVYHTDILCLPFLPHSREQAKLSMVSTLEFSADPLIRECLCLLKDSQFTNRMHGYPFFHLLHSAGRKDLFRCHFQTEAQTCHRTVVEKISH